MEQAEPNEQKILEEAKEMARIVREVVEANPGADPENVRHAYLLLKLPPEERLRRALIRGRLFKHSVNRS